MVRTRCQLHPIVLDFLYKQSFKTYYPLQGQMIINLFTDTEEMEQNIILFAAYAKLNAILKHPITFYRKKIHPMVVLVGN